MSRKRFNVTVDIEADAAYVTMSDEPVASTVEVSEEVLVDLDAMRVVVGIEFLRIDAEIPFSRLVDEFHVHSEDVELLRLLRPSIGTQLSLRQGSDGVSAQARDRALVSS